MIVYVALVQPDGDWDHLATLLGVYTTNKAAKQRIIGRREGVVMAVELDIDVKEEYAATNC